MEALTSVLLLVILVILVIGLTRRLVDAPSSAPRQALLAVCVWGPYLHRIAKHLIVWCVAVGLILAGI